MKQYFFILIVLLVSCSTHNTYQTPDFGTPEGYGRMVNTWVGVESEKLIYQWGVPKSSIDMNNGRRALEYYNSVTVPIMTGGALIPITADCRTTFVVGANGIIENVSFYGNRCKAR